MRLAEPQIEHGAWPVFPYRPSPATVARTSYPVILFDVRVVLPHPLFIMRCTQNCLTLAKRLSLLASISIVPW